MGPPAPATPRRLSWSVGVFGTPGGGGSVPTGRPVPRGGLGLACNCARVVESPHRKSPRSPVAPAAGLLPRSSGFRHPPLRKESGAHAALRASLESLAAGL